MTFEEVVDQASAMLQRRGRVTYRLLKRQFNLDDEALEDLKEELIYGQKLAVDEDGRVLVWTGTAGQMSQQSSSTPLFALPPDTQKDSPTLMPLSLAEPHPLDAERRQLTVMFCDLTDSTALATQLDPEELREVVRAYQEACAKVIARYEGHVALHWVDPSTLELLSLLVDQAPTARLLALLTFRPDFSPPWTGRSHFTQVTLHRLTRQQVAEMIGRIAHGKVLPAEVVEQIVAKTDGVPLFVEELTKMVLESGLLQEREERYALTGPLPPLAIPATLHDSLMARLDRLATVKGLAQLGATLGREFSYELLHAVSPWDEETLRRGLHQLVEAEFLYQQGLPPQATYLFKHALIQDAAYQSLLRSTRQQHHQHIAQVLEARFPDLCATQPELLAHHYTEAGLMAQAIPYWQQAGTRAVRRSTHVEAIAHVQRGLALLAALPDTPQRTQHELDFLTTLGPALMATKGYAAPEVVQAYSRARELCQQIGETPEHVPILWNLWFFYMARAEHQTAIELGEQYLQIAQRVQDATLLLEAHYALGISWFMLGSLALAGTHMEQIIALYAAEQHRGLAYRYGGIDTLAWGALAGMPGSYGCAGMSRRPAQRQGPEPRPTARPPLFAGAHATL